MKTIQSMDEQEVDQIRRMLVEARKEATRIAEASRSLRDMVDLITAMVLNHETPGPVEEEVISNTQIPHCE